MAGSTGRLAALDWGGWAARFVFFTGKGGVGKTAGRRGGARPDRLHVVEANPAAALIDMCRDAQLPVVGSRGHGAFTGMLLGPVSQHCVQHACCPVLVVR